jgi:single-strand DNA-binding protein
MPGVNKVILIGNLGRDPETRKTAAGEVCTLRLAVSERRKEGDGWKEHTEWVPVVCFGKTAEHAGQYLAKGRQVYVEGRMQTRQYKDKEGNDKWSTEVVANTVTFLGSKDGAAPKVTAVKPDAFADDDADLPF